MNELETPRWVVTVYLVYLALSVSLTVWVARTLFHNGRLFLVDTFRGNEALADSVNRMLVVGFYLVNIGFVTLALRTRESVVNAREAIELLSVKVGVVLLVLGAMHFMNILVFSRYRRNAMETAVVPPAPTRPPLIHG